MKNDNKQMGKVIDEGMYIKIYQENGTHAPIGKRLIIEPELLKEFINYEKPQEHWIVGKIVEIMQGVYGRTINDRVPIED